MMLYRDLAFIACSLLVLIGSPVWALAGNRGLKSSSLPDKRVPWTTSRVRGTPEPPPPYKAVRAFPRLSFKNPLLLSNAPGSNRLFIGEQAGRIYSFPNDQAAARADIFIDLANELKSWDPAGKVKGVSALYGLTFHPDFAKNRYCYICYVLDSKTGGEQLPDGTRVSRFRVTDTDPPRCDPKSEKVIITWLAGGHNGGCLCFGPDKCLYISTGDATSPNPPDALDTGQDLSDLLSSILRIDVDREDPGRAYAVPRDNPFVDMPKIRPEIWSYGFRNPWKMSFDRLTGDLWAGDVGWELWEMVYRIKKAGNYGWSVMEGRQPVRPDSRRGPTPILPPTIDFPHTDAASITGGFVYRGKQWPDLYGHYVCGDWLTGKMWATRFDGERMVAHREICQVPYRIVTFSEDNDGELYFVHYDENNGTLHRLVPNEIAGTGQPPFPRRLSETGLFLSTRTHEPAAGVLPFAIEAPQWADHATAERFVALPGTSVVTSFDNPQPLPGAFFTARWFFPPDAVLAKTFHMEMERGNPASRKRLETQVLHFDGQAWRGYSYAWNEEQTDAVLVPAGGQDLSLQVRDSSAPGGRRQQTWHFPSRTECLTCHNPWAGGGLSFTHPQLQTDVISSQGSISQLEYLYRLGYIVPGRPGRQGGEREPRKPMRFLTNPYDTRADLAERSRSYLHVNCSHCHQMGGGGTADMDIRYEMTLEQTRTVETRPTQGTFEIHGAHILSPGDPYRSVLYYRMAKLGRGRMPHVGSEIVDEAGLALMREWIRHLPARKDDRQLVERLRELDESAALRLEQAQSGWQRERLAVDLAVSAGRSHPTAADRAKAANEWQQICETHARQRSSERAETVQRLLGTTSGALALVQYVETNRLSPTDQSQILKAAMARPEMHVRDLFERFVQDSERVRRLGSVIKVEQLLGLKGDTIRGKDLFFKNTAVQCMSCHRVGSQGSTLGPDLSQIGKKLTRAQLIESILEPSKSIDPQYVTYLVETTDGIVYTGLLKSKNDKEVVLRDVKDKEIRIPTAKIEKQTSQGKSLMPDLLLRDLTPEQVGDLLAFLEGLK